MFNGLEVKGTKKIGQQMRRKFKIKVGYLSKNNDCPFSTVK